MIGPTSAVESGNRYHRWIELRQLAHFVALAEELHFTRAAARVHLAQSSFSASVSALERDLGERLVVREHHRVALTAAGRALLPAARRALASAREGRDAVAGLRGVLHGELRIGAIQTLGVVDLAALLARFHRDHPQVALRVVHAAASRLLEQAAAAELDVVFVDGPTDPARTTAVPLGTDRLCLVVPRSDPLAARTTIRLDDVALASREFVEYRPDSALRAQVDVASAAAGLARRVACVADTVTHLVDGVRHGLGVAVLPPAAVAGSADVVAVPIVPELRRTVSAAFSGVRGPTAAVRALLDLVS